MKKYFIPLSLFLSILVATPNSARSQSSPNLIKSVEEGHPTVEEIIERAERASGGKAAWSAITAMHINGTVEVPATKLTGTFESYSKAPNKKYQSLIIGNSLVSKAGFDGTAGWKIVPGRASMDVQGDELEDLRLDADFYSAVDLKQLFPQMLPGADTIIQGRPAYTVIATPLQGKSRKLFFDKETGLQIGSSQETSEDGKVLNLEAYFSDFKTVQGVQIPYTIQESSEKSVIVLHIQEVQVNAVILNSIFLKPTVKVESAGPAPSSPAVARTQFGSGSVSGNTYKDSTFSFLYTFPAGWTVRSQEAEEQALRMVGQFESRANPSAKAAYEAKMARTSLLLSVTQYPSGAAGRFNSTIEVSAERMDWAPGIQSGKDYLLNLEAGLKRVALPMEFGPGIPEVMIAGKRFYRLDVDIPLPIVRVHLAYFSTRIGNSILSFAFTTVSKGDLEMLCKTLDSVQFDAPKQ